MLRLNRACERVDGVEPFNEATRLHLAAADEPRVLVERDGGAAVGFDDAPVELAVHPERRCEGVGHDLITAALDAGESRFWAHGDLPGAQALARSVGLQVARTLLVLRRPADPVGEARVADGVTLRTATPDDHAAIIDINRRAFADHPEQGAMDRADFERRTAQPWFDPNGLFVAEHEGTVVGFHWTKIEDDSEGRRWGEVYVVGVDPDHHGSGLGTALTARGLQHLVAAGVAAIDLYVEGDNAAALTVYRRLGFAEHARDVLYTSQ